MADRTTMAWLMIPAAVACGLPLQASGQEGTPNLEATYAFLVSERDARGGVLHNVNTGSLAGLKLPFSFLDSADYWGAYVCALPGNFCAVTDVYSPQNYTLAPEAGHAGDLQTERVDVHNGTNIYDAATWQIAVVLGDVNHGYLSGSSHDAYALATAQTRLLSEGVSGASGVRAVTTRSTFLYNGQEIADPQSAYAFRMVSSVWLSPDPFMGSRYASLVATSRLPADQPDYQSGKVTWSDWKPVTGENAWAFLLGPLQAAYLHYLWDKRQLYVPVHDLGVQNALHVLPTFAAMQSSSGGVYYAPSGSSPNQGKGSINPHLVSVENNFSLYAGLRVLQQTLRMEAANEKDLSRSDQSAIQTALGIIDIMIGGGATARGSSTKGLLDFFRNSAWLDGEFIVGGLAEDPQAGTAWAPTREPKAVDVNTWGISALGADQLDQWFGFGASYRLWQSVKGWGAYGVGSTLWGVGYSDQDGNGLRPDGTFQQGVLSTEWTAGAINAVRNMIHHYQFVPPGTDHSAEARAMVQSLMRDEHDMLWGIEALRADRYLHTDFPGKPPDAVNVGAGTLQPYLYASRRYLIPFGWYANPIPSTCSTAWILMLADRFDPLRYGGSPW
ncbi:MAG TPA: hypothetical protein VKC11_08115 [Steroidobacteraceae bacterium]|nr:hypothetical protein [Steroidobacteraceae bacterium]